MSRSCISLSLMIYTDEEFNDGFTMIIKALLKWQIVITAICLQIYSKIQEDGLEASSAYNYTHARQNKRVDEVLSIG